MKVMGNATAYVGGQQGRPLPKVPDRLHPAHRPWCSDCKKKHDAADLDENGRCPGCARAAVTRAAAAERRAEREAAEQAAAAEAKAQQARIKQVVRETVGPPVPPPTIPVRTERPARPAPARPQQAGNQGEPTTRRSAPRATSPSSGPGAAPGAGSADHREKNPPAAPETRPVAAGGPSHRDQLEARLHHIETVVRRAATIDDPIVGMLRTSALASIEALHVYLELHHPHHHPDARGADSMTPLVGAAGLTSPESGAPRGLGLARPAAAAEGEATRQPAPARRGRRLPSVDVDERAICTEYQAGDTRPQVARRHGVLPKRITQILQKHHIEIRDDRRGHSGSTPRVFDQATIDHAVELYTSGQTIADVAAAIGTGGRQTTNLLRAAGVTIRPPVHAAGTDLTEDQCRDAVQQYLAGKSLADVARTFHVRADTIRALVVGAGHQPRSKGDTFAARARRVAALGVTPLDIKRWGVEQGLLDTVTRGHTPTHVLDAYEAAHAAERSAP